MKKLVPISVAALAVATLVFWFATRESPEQKIDREVGWKKVTPYYTTTHGVEIGQVTVPGHTQRVTFFLWGIPKESYLDEDEEPRIIGEMDRDVYVKDQDDLAGLDRIALAAYNHGGTGVILTEHKAYLVTSDTEEEDAEVAREAIAR
jgi:nitrogen fixation-related uncharacterized protein